VRSAGCCGVCHHRRPPSGQVRAWWFAPDRGEVVRASGKGRERDPPLSAMPGSSAPAPPSRVRVAGRRAGI